MRRQRARAADAAPAEPQERRNSFWFWALVVGLPLLLLLLAAGGLALAVVLCRGKHGKPTAAANADAEAPTVAPEAPFEADAPWAESAPLLTPEQIEDEAALRLAQGPVNQVGNGAIP